LEIGKSNIKNLKIIECPRDAMQGLKDFIPTEVKAAYINTLLKVGFDTIDFGSFVSPKIIPQMQDTAEVLKRLDLSQTSTKLLAIVANVRGAESATQFDEITYLGYPLSISETFQKRNTNHSILESLEVVSQIQNLCLNAHKNLVVYISMAFGNPYYDPYNEEVVVNFTQKLADLGIKIISLADTVGLSNVENIRFLFDTITPLFPNIEIGAHLHSKPLEALEKIQTAYQAGCRRFDGALLGFGGCPMAKDDLVGNIPTEVLIDFFKQSIELNIHRYEWENAMAEAKAIFL
jgi:hydroxymethylglutaryl-CoA lyase